MYITKYSIHSIGIVHDHYTSLTQGVYVQWKSGSLGVCLFAQIFTKVAVVEGFNSLIKDTTV